MFYSKHTDGLPLKIFHEDFIQKLAVASRKIEESSFWGSSLLG